MLIWNQKGELFTRVYDPVEDTIWKNVPFKVWARDVDTSYIDESLKEKVTHQTIVYGGGRFPTWHKDQGKSTHPVIPHWLSAAYRTGSFEVDGFKVPTYSQVYNQTKILSWGDREKLIKIGKAVNRSTGATPALSELSTFLLQEYGQEASAYWYLSHILDMEGSEADQALEIMCGGPPADLDAQEQHLFFINKLDGHWAIHDYFLAQAVAITNQILEEKDPKVIRNLLRIHGYWNDWITVYEYSDTQSQIST